MLSASNRCRWVSFAIVSSLRCTAHGGIYTSSGRHGHTGMVGLGVRETVFTVAAGHIAAQRGRSVGILEIVQCHSQTPLRVLLRRRPRLAGGVVSYLPGFFRGALLC